MSLNTDLIHREELSIFVNFLVFQHGARLQRRMRARLVLLIWRRRGRVSVTAASFVFELQMVSGAIGRPCVSKTT